MITKNLSRILGTLLIVFNIAYFIPLTITTLNSGGGGFGYGLLLLPITFVSHLFLISSALTWINNDDKQVGFLVINSIGTIWVLFWYVLFITIPE